ncbi:MAG: hypothetical protein IT378_20220 [Sandaracinaceae bacterium]|nr:hypothetical protein [Sandaracinaceae bacterium]
MALLHDAGVHRERLATLLYVCRRAPSRVELEHASLWCDDLIGDEGPFGPRLRRRVQALALAPWRRALVARVEAERRGQARLRLVRGAAPASPRARG